MVAAKIPEVMVELLTDQLQSNLFAWSGMSLLALGNEVHVSLLESELKGLVEPDKALGINGVLGLFITRILEDYAMKKACHCFCK